MSSLGVDDDYDLICRVEKILEMVDYDPKFEVPRLKEWISARFSPECGIQLEVEKVNFATVSYDNPTTQKRFKVIARLLDIIQGLLRTNAYTTRRDIYYTDVKFFGRQEVVNQAVDMLVVMLRVPRYRLHVGEEFQLCSSKGVVCGDLRWTDASDVLTDCRTASAIPVSIEDLKFEHCSAQAILIVEKDAVMQYLIGRNIHKEFNLLVVTGKGMPDYNSRRLVRRLFDEFHLPIMVMVDGNPWGMQIFLVWKYGSLSLAFESHLLVLTSATLLGVTERDCQMFGVRDDQRVSLSERDRSKAQTLLQSPPLQADQLVRNEVETMLLKGKTEIETLTAQSENYLLYKLSVERGLKYSTAARNTEP